MPKKISLLAVAAATGTALLIPAAAADAAPAGSGQQTCQAPDYDCISNSTQDDHESMPDYLNLGTDTVGGNFAGTTAP
ncbi:hypothetical protein P0W64_07165 [Tsukamurella sp. 8F]|uniref:hypothetical protein n=1 Tax=unclassified Tsukamurella TaxID=2633480 RepID=UPI0023B9471E|nr:MULTISPECIES: hypothetical protein [unclassified Tsukamurella]MDF0530236.1 hypothetical protein [Tsukamurella sp. 8J]MDF0586553.1 hypothetical protein [Tsukamurella sp. 8F]